MTSRRNRINFTIQFQPNQKPGKYRNGKITKKNIIKTKLIGKKLEKQ